MRLSGFSLIELLVVVAIIAGLVIFTIPNFKNIRQEQAIGEALGQVQTSLRTAQNNAYSGLRCSSTKDSTLWRVNFTSATSYQLECLLAISPPPTDPNQPLFEKPFSKSFTLPSGVTIGGIILNNCEPLLSDVAVSFSNISSLVTFMPSSLVNKFSGQCSEKQLRQAKKMTLTIGGKTVIVEKGGIISVQN